MTSTDKAEDFREFLEACDDRPPNTKLVIHTSLDYFIDVMDRDKALRVLAYVDEHGNTTIRSEWQTSSTSPTE